MKVLKAFVDKDTRKGYNKGDTFVSKDSERVSYLAELGYIVKPKEEEKPQKKAKKTTSKKK
jgi:hypothetical protein